MIKKQEVAENVELNVRRDVTLFELTPTRTAEPTPNAKAPTTNSVEMPFDGNVEMSAETDIQ